MTELALVWPRDLQAQPFTQAHDEARALDLSPSLVDGVFKRALVRRHRYSSLKR